MEVKIQARIAFPNIFEPSVSDDGTSSYNASFLMAPDSPSVKVMKDAIAKVAKEKWADKADAVLKSLKANNAICLKDGELKAHLEGYEGNMFVSARNSARPTVVDRDRSPLTATDGKIYSGCYVNALLEIWAQDNKFGKRVNAKLTGVQFVKDGVPFAGGKSVASADAFDVLDDEVEEVF